MIPEKVIRTYKNVAFEKHKNYTYKELIMS